MPLVEAFFAEEFFFAAGFLAGTAFGISGSASISAMAAFSSEFRILIRREVTSLFSEAISAA